MSAIKPTLTPTMQRKHGHPFLDEAQSDARIYKCSRSRLVKLIVHPDIISPKRAKVVGSLSIEITGNFKNPMIAKRSNYGISHEQAQQQSAG